MIAGDLLDLAKQQAFEFLGPQEISDTALLSHLSNLDEELVLAIHQHVPALLLRPDELTCSTIRNTDGYRLKDAIGYDSFFYKMSTGETSEIKILPALDVYQSKYSPAGVVASGLTGMVFLPADPFKKDWTDQDTDERPHFIGDGDSILYRYLAAPSVLETLEDELVSPDFARAFFVQSLVTFITSVNGSTERVAKAAARESELRNAAYTQIFRHTNITSSITTGVLYND